MNFLRKLLIVTVLFSSPFAYSESATDFASLLNAVQTMQADFKQTVYDHRDKAIQTSFGTMAFVRPGKFRWQARRPIPQLIIANGSKLWIYDPDLQQVIIRSLQKAAGATPALLLSHVSVSLDNDFAITEIPQKQAGWRWFQLKPRKKESMFETVQMGFVNNQIHEMQLQDQLGHTTKIQFSHAKINQTIAPNSFEFKNPPHVDVIDETRKK